MNKMNNISFGCNHCNGAIGKLVGKGASKKQAERQVIKDVGGSIKSTSTYHVKQAEAYLSDLRTKPSVLQGKVAEASRIEIKA